MKLGQTDLPVSLIFIVHISYHLPGWLLALLFHSFWYEAVERISSGTSSLKRLSLSDLLGPGEGAESRQACSSCHSFAARPRACCCKVTTPAVLLRIVNLRVVTSCILRHSSLTQGSSTETYLTRSIGLESASEAPCLTFPYRRVLWTRPCRGPAALFIPYSTSLPSHQLHCLTADTRSVSAIAILYNILLFTCEGAAFLSTTTYELHDSFSCSPPLTSNPKQPAHHGRKDDSVQAGGARGWRGRENRTDYTGKCTAD